MLKMWFTIIFIFCYSKQYGTLMDRLVLKDLRNKNRLSRHIYAIVFVGFGRGRYTVMHRALRNMPAELAEVDFYGCWFSFSRSMRGLFKSFGADKHHAQFGAR